MAARPTPTVEVRPATPHDSGRLLAWANDPVTRAASFRTGTIDPAGHERWLADRLASPSCRLLIGWSGAVAIGQVRFERGPDGRAELGVSLDPVARGLGLGSALLRAALEAVRGDVGFGAITFVAHVRTDNTASLRLFERAGFQSTGPSVCEDVPCVVLELRGTRDGRCRPGARPR